MKKIIVSLFSILLIIFIGCADFLDKQPDDMKTDEMVWTSRTQVEGYLANIYAGLTDPMDHSQDPWLGLSDEIDLTWAVYPTYNINLGNWSPNSGYHEKYNLYYRAIRASFVLENNIDRCKELSSDLITQYKAEAKFLRGYYYWLLLRLYGPVVLLKEQQPNDADFPNMMRATFDECVEYIVEMMDEAKKDLPLHWRNNQTHLGRPNKIVCNSVKSIVLTYAASPQWNGNSEYADFKNPDGTVLVNTTYDESKWKKAAEASLEVIKISENNSEADLRLYKNNQDGGIFNPYKSCVDVHIRKWNSEIIFGRYDPMIKDGQGAQSWMVHATPGPRNLGGVAPTQRVVDAFLMGNGKTIDDPSSGYMEVGFATSPHQHWNPNNRTIGTEEGRKQIIQDIRESVAWGHWEGEWNMYANREPRFYAYILYNKRIVPQFADDMNKRNSLSSPSQKDGYGRVELYYGGISRQSGAYTFFPRTGYLVLKKVDPQAEMYDRIYPQAYMNVYIRYAQILLDYIEALNEYSPANPDIRKYWDMIRERAGVPSVFITYPEIAGNKDLQRDFILRERQIELCFEGDRYLTSRRRWLAHTLDEGGPIDNRKWGDGGRFWGMDINAGDPVTNDFSFTGFYKRVPFETRVFKKEYYIFPIPQSEINKSNTLIQNPWW